jgi:hypothetical protein
VLSVSNVIVTSNILPNPTTIAANTGVSIRWVKIITQIQLMHR